MQYYRLHLHHRDICYASPKRGKYSSDVMQCFKIILGKETKAQRPLRAGGRGVVLALFKDACPLTEVGVVVYYHVNGNQNSHALYSPRPLGPGTDLLHSPCNRSTHTGPITGHISTNTVRLLKMTFLICSLKPGGMIYSSLHLGI